ncbi:tRNA1(Val) (adenine(37)-N6)-methyltransferase [Algoriphagus sp. A40]|uniref:tRNA1(Val) (adenine(37)-N6)-methyltransferase n=1 Tax=Algoriphagus sp. A40 TaxID=1945863 RepID=UPI000986AB43|nr:methyltransferase [Algoriphagus sp. A40]OOG74338.1 16S rRNA (cytosine(1402)-N(4))-methyltransferase [Algoriphagus sp. A40]
MGNSWFQFQQFRIHQDRCAMKISTDAVLLGSLANAENPNQILDIGTGTGVIALMLAQRFPESKVTAVEIDPDAAEQAKENFQESKFSQRLEIFHGRIQDLPEKEKFDLIVSNPPFFPEHLKSKDSKRNKALHTDELSFEELINKTIQLLSSTGVFWVILPPRQMQDLELLAQKSGLYLFQKVRVKDQEDKPVHREIGGFEFQVRDKKEEILILKDQKLAYSSSYSSLLSGFLLGY